MRSSVLRATRQQSLAGFRRYASTSTSSNAAAQAQAGAAKAQEAATKYAGKAMAVLGKSGDLFARLASKTGGRTGKMLKNLEAAIPPTIYYSKVAFEVSKIVFRGQKMTPPDLDTFKSSFKLLLNLAILNAFARNAIQSVRSANTKDLAFVGVLGAEVLGFFTIGEIIGRRKLVGYRGKVDVHH